MFKRLRQKLGIKSYIQNLFENPTDLSTLKQKPSVRFSVGIGVIIFSYLMAWPFISVLGIISLLVDNAMIVAIGGPLAYGLSYLVLFMGIWLAGKDGLVYIKSMIRWFMEKVCRRLFRKT